MYHRSFEKYERLVKAPVDYDKPRDFCTKVYVFWGPTGSGKTRLVHRMFPGVYVCSSDDGQWFDGYLGDENALFDDFNGHSVPITLLLKLCDRYPLRVPIKGGFVQWRPRRLFFTSNICPDNWYLDANPENRRALWRRVDCIREFPCDDGLINFDYV